MKIHRLSKTSTVTVLAYHRVIEMTEEFGLYPGIISATPAEFEKQIKYLAKKYSIISFGQLKQLAESETTERANYLLITFDDGYQDNYTHAYPVLLKYGVPAAFFVTTGFIGRKIIPWWDKLAYLINRTRIKRLEVPGFAPFDLSSKKEKRQTIHILNNEIPNMGEKEKGRTLEIIEQQLGNTDGKALRDSLFMSWKQMAQMKAKGMEFFPHTTSHCNLAKTSLKKAKKEIADSKSLLERKLGVKTNVFCYPYDSSNPSVKEIIKKMGFFCAFSANFGLNYLGEKLDWHSLKRIEVSHKDSLVALRMKINFFTHQLYRLKRKLR